MSHKQTGNSNKMIFNQSDWASRKDFEQLKSMNGTYRIMIYL